MDLFCKKNFIFGVKRGTHFIRLVLLIIVIALSQTILSMQNHRELFMQRLQM